MVKTEEETLLWIRETTKVNLKQHDSVTVWMQSEFAYVFEIYSANKKWNKNETYTA